jgi:hypothetical protein
MINLLNATDQSGIPSARQLARLEKWTKLYIQNRGAASVFIATNPDELISAGLLGTQQGLEIVAGPTIRELTWIGELWGLGSAAQCLLDVQIVGHVAIGSERHGA